MLDRKLLLKENCSVVIPKRSLGRFSQD